MVPRALQNRNVLQNRNFFLPFRSPYILLAGNRRFRVRTKRRQKNVTVLQRSVNVKFILFERFEN